MSRTVAVVLAIVALALLGGGYYRHTHRAEREIVVEGGDGGGLPLAQPPDEHLDGAALEQAARDPVTAGLEAFLVMRHGHLVFERFGHGLTGESVVDSGPFARVLVALLAGVAAEDGAVRVSTLGRFDARAWSAAIEHRTHVPYPQLLSQRLWSRLNAAPARIAQPAGGGTSAAIPADCCFEARIEDWLRVAALLANGGRFEGTQVVAPQWIAAMRQASTADGRSGLGVELARAAHGDQPLADDEMIFLRGPAHWRLWVSPKLRLAVLFGAQAQAATDVAGAPSGADAADAAVGAAARDGWDETRLPNLVIEAVTDRTTPQKAESLLQQLVPHH